MIYKVVYAWLSASIRRLKPHIFKNFSGALYTLRFLNKTICICLSRLSEFITIHNCVQSFGAIFLSEMLFFSKIIQKENLHQCLLQYLFIYLLCVYMICILYYKIFHVYKRNYNSSSVDRQKLNFRGDRKLQWNFRRFSFDFLIKSTYFQKL